MSATMATINFAAQLLAKPPKGEYYLYTDMKRALDGIIQVAQGSALPSGNNSPLPPAPVPEGRDAISQSLLEMATRPGSESLYLDSLANIAIPQSQELSLKNGRSDVVISPAPDAPKDALSVVRLVLSSEPNATSDVVISINAPSPLLLQCKVNVAENAKLNLVLMQSQKGADRLFTRSTIDLSANASANISFVNIEPLLARNEIKVGLQAEGADLKMNGLYSVAEGGNIVNESLVEHLVGHCSSSQLFKGIASANGIMAFGGLIKVAPNAQKTSAEQTNRHMLASLDAHAYAKPQLEIYADDVKCSHGATTGQIDPAQLFYMLQRGIDEQTARRLLSAAFVGEVVDRIPLADVRQHLTEILTGEKTLIED